MTLETSFILESTLNTTETKNNFTLKGDKITSFESFNPQVDKGIIYQGESNNKTQQYIMNIENKDGLTERKEVFIKNIKNKDRATIEKETYQRCANNNVDTLKLIATVESAQDTANITETDHYIVPFSRLNMKNNIKFYEELCIKGLGALERIHNIGIHHRDSLTRNIAMDMRKKSRCFAFDFETATLTQTSNNNPLPLELKKREQDYDLFLEDLFFKFLSQNLNNQDLIEEAENLKTKIKKESLKNYS